METGCNEERSPNREDQNAWWLEPDPVIEFYMGKVDRAAIRENLKLTPGQRVERFQARMGAQLANQPERTHSNPNSGMQLREVSSQRLSDERGEVVPRTHLSQEDCEDDRGWLEIDPVVAAYMKDIDQTLTAETLKLTPAQRVNQFESFVESLEEFRQAGERMREKTK